MRSATSSGPPPGRSRLAARSRRRSSGAVNRVAGAGPGRPALARAAGCGRFGGPTRARPGSGTPRCVRPARRSPAPRCCRPRRATSGAGTGAPVTRTWCARRCRSPWRRRGTAMSRCDRGSDRGVVGVAEALVDPVCDAGCRLEARTGVIQHGDVERPQLRSHPGSSKACTVIDSSSGAPNVVTMATSEASRPRPITAAALTALVVARVERPPPVAQPDLHPGGEVHRRRVRRHVHVRQVAEDVAGRNVQRPAERDGQVGEVAADAEPGVVDVDRGRLAARCSRTGTSGVR